MEVGDERRSAAVARHPCEPRGVMTAQLPPAHTIVWHPLSIPYVLHITHRSPKRRISRGELGRADQQGEAKRELHFVEICFSDGYHELLGVGSRSIG